MALDPARIAAQKRKAFEDFYQLPSYGYKRTASGLHAWYLARMKEDKMQRGDIPTLNREQLYTWRTEDHWEEKAAQRDREIIDRDGKRYDEVRAKVYTDLSLMLTKGVTTLEKLLEEKDAKIRLAAVELLFDRAGLPKAQPDRIQKHIPKNPERELADAPAIDATDEALDAWLRETSGSNINA